MTVQDPYIEKAEIILRTISVLQTLPREDLLVMFGNARSYESINLLNQTKKGEITNE